MSEIFRKIAQAVINSDAFLQEIENLIADHTERAIKQEAAGDRFYVAQNNREDIKARNKMIIAQFNGRNIDDLAKRFNLKPRQIRNILQKGIA
jgi:Mor family transcriptional regulator